MGASRKTIREWVAGRLSRRHDITITAVDTDTTLLTAASLDDISEDDERFVDSFLTYNTDGDVVGDMQNLHWRRVTVWNRDLSQLAINRSFDDSLTPDLPISGSIYTVLNPTEWNEAINEALVALYFEERVAIDLVDEDTNPTHEYDLSSVTIGASWIQYKGMIVDVYYRNLTTGREYPVPRYKLQENRNAVTLRIVDKQWSSTTYELIVVAKRYYPRLNEDDWGTTCPTPLWQAAVEVSAIHKIMKKVGQRLKPNYAQELAIAERSLAEARAMILPVLTAREYTVDEGWVPPDISEFFTHGGWA